MQTLGFGPAALVSSLVKNSPIPLECLYVYQAMQTQEKSFLLLL